MKEKFYAAALLCGAIGMTGCADNSSNETICGDRICEGGETVVSCPQDCGNLPSCGNGVCNDGENPINCPQDCNSCGNGTCDNGETPESCPQDCSEAETTCGNHFCEREESSGSCPQDCFCGNKTCDSDEIPDTCPSDCPRPVVCGDGVCNGIETRHNCPKDCPPFCGDGICEGGEYPGTCPDDCIATTDDEEYHAVCGDGTCDDAETENSCPQDCKIAETLPKLSTMEEFNGLKETPNRFLFDYDRAMDPKQETAIEDFFAFPFPGELRTKKYGHPDLSKYPLPDLSNLNSFSSILPELGTLVPSLVESVQTERLGFSPIGAVYFRASVPISQASLTQNSHNDDPGKTAEPNSCFQIINVEQKSKHYGERIPVYITYHRATNKLWAQNTLVMRPVPGVGPHPGDRHVAVVTDCLRTNGSRKLNQSNKLRYILNNAAPEEISKQTSYYVNQLRELEKSGKLGFKLSQIRAITGYDTMEVVDEMMQMANELKGKGHIVTDENGVAVPVEVNPGDHGWTKYPNASVFRGQFVTCNFISGEYPKDSTPIYNKEGGGKIEFDTFGALESKCHKEKVFYEITVPDTPMPENGYPIAVYGHGTGGDARTHSRYYSISEGRVLLNNKVPVAMIGFDACLQGNRTAGEGSEAALYMMMLTNPVIIRESVRQTVNDMLVLYDIIKDKKLVLPPRPGEQTNVTFDPSYGLYMGHSQGSQEAGLLLAVSDQVKNAFLSAGGGGTLLSFVELKPDFSGIKVAETILKDKSIADILAMIFNLEQGSISYDTFITNHIVQPLMDPIDPLNFAPHFIHDPLKGMNSKNIAQTVGINDRSTPNSTQFAMIASTGLPFIGQTFVEDPAIRIAGLDKNKDINSVSNNIRTDTGTVTGAAMQFKYTGTDNPHFVIYDMQSAKHSYINFFRSVIEGNTTVSVSGKQENNW